MAYRQPMKCFIRSLVSKSIVLNIDIVAVLHQVKENDFVVSLVTEIIKSLLNHNRPINSFFQSLRRLCNSRENLYASQKAIYRFWK